MIHIGVWINPEHVTLVQQNGGMTRVTFTNGRHVDVSKGIDEVAGLINKALEPEIRYTFEPIFVPNPDE